MADFMSTNFDLPENIFYFYNNDLSSLEFVLDWDTENGFYKQLLNRYFATVLVEQNGHALVLAKPNETKYFHDKIPAFDIKFIEDCFRLKDYPDPNLYVIKNSCPLTYKMDDIYDVWYHMRKTWSDLIGSEHADNQNVAIPCSKVDKDSSSSEEEILMINERVAGSRTSSSTRSSSPNKKTRLPYSQKEDIGIVKYVVENKHAFDIAGREMWERMERANVCKIRSWQSMKERYLKHIKWDLQYRSAKYQFLSKNDIKMLRQGLKIEAIRPKDKEELKSKILEARIDSYASDQSI